MGLFGSYAIGLAFAFGWTPASGECSQQFLSLAAVSESVSKRAVLLAVYSLGLGIPFLIAVEELIDFLGFFVSFRQKLGTVEKLMGCILVLAGLLFLTGGTQSISYWLLEQSNLLQKIG